LPLAKAGDLILVATVADGADAMLLRVTPAARVSSRFIRSGRMIESKGDVTYATSQVARDSADRTAAASRP